MCTIYNVCWLNAYHFGPIERQYLKMFWLPNLFIFFSGKENARGPTSLCTPYLYSFLALAYSKMILKMHYLFIIFFF